MEKWFVAAKKADFEAWSKKLNITPVTARIIRNRDIFSEEEAEKYLNGSFLDMYAPERMMDLEDAAAIMKEEIKLKHKIRVIGDYDVDGISASYILTGGLRALSANVDTVIPHRMKDGYGLSDELIEDAYKDGIQTIITCDNGIAAYNQIALAKEHGMTVVVTDHHEVPYEINASEAIETEDGITIKERHEILPPAAAIVDPKRLECEYPYKNICGAVVAYKLIELMFRKSSLEPEVKQKYLDDYIQMAAMATVCDVMDLLDENRIIVKEGLKQIHKAPCIGLKALIEVNGIEQSKVTAFHMGFVLGPCMNATGRLDSAKRALNMLEAQSLRDAVTIAGELKEMNDSRKTMTLSGVDAAVKVIEQEHMVNDSILVVFLPDCHESIAGIIAGRIREKYAKPTFILTRGEEGIKGSGRSIESYNMYEAMCECKSLFIKYGGHKMAAGLSMREEDINTLRSLLNEKCRLTGDDFIEKVHIDVPMPLSYINKEFVAELSCLEPYGNGNPKPLFATKQIHFTSGILLGKKGNFAKYTVMENGKEYKLVFFGNLDKFHLFLDEKMGHGASTDLYHKKCDYILSITYQLSFNTYMGKTEIQIVMQNYC